MHGQQGMFNRSKIKFGMHLFLCLVALVPAMLIFFNVAQIRASGCSDPVDTKGAQGSQIGAPTAHQGEGSIPRNVARKTIYLIGYTSVGGINVSQYPTALPKP